jgi:radical SAM protein with 4Fe4S-binding SPASM domain
LRLPARNDFDLGAEGFLTMRPSRTTIKLYWRLWKNFKASYGYYFYLLRRRQAARIRRILKEGRMPAPGSFFPTKINLRLLYDCNLRCKMCGQWGETGAYFAYDNAKRKARLEIDAIDRVLGELAPLGLKLVDMEGGETLLYPEFEELLLRMRRRDLHVKFATNGTLLHKFADAIVESGVKSITVSLDGDRETHNKIRGSSWVYDRTLQGLRVLAETKRRKRRNNPLVQIAFTMNRHNGAATLKGLCHGLRGQGLADVLEIKLTPIFVPEWAEKAYLQLVQSYFNVDEGILSPGGFREDYSDFAEEARSIVEVVTELQGESFDFFLEPLPHIPFDQIPRLYSDYTWDLGRAPCPVPFDEPTVDADGNVYPCNLFTDVPLSMGDIHTFGFLEIWQGPRFAQFRRMLMENGGLLPICSRCCQLTES